MLNTSKQADFTDRFYSPKTKWPKIELDYYQLPAYYSFDLEAARVEFMRIQTDFSLRPFTIGYGTSRERPLRTYLGLGLTSRPTAKEPLYHALELQAPDGSRV